MQTRDEELFFGRNNADSRRKVFWHAHRVVYEAVGSGPTSWDAAVSAGLTKGLSKRVVPLAEAIDTYGEECLVGLLDSIVDTCQIRSYSKTSLCEVLNKWCASLLSFYEQQEGSESSERLLLVEPRAQDAQTIIRATYSQYELINALLRVIKEKAKKSGVDVLEGLAPMWVEAKLCNTLCLKSPRNLMDAVSYIDGLDGGTSLARTQEEENHFLKRAFEQALGIYVCERWSTGIIEVTEAPPESSVIVSGRVDIDVSQPMITEMYKSSYLTVVKRWYDLCTANGAHLQSETFVSYCSLYGGAALENVLGHMEQKNLYPAAHMIPRFVFELYGENPWVLANNKVKERINLLAGEPGVGLVELLNGSIRFHRTK